MVVANKLPHPPTVKKLQDIPPTIHTVLAGTKVARIFYAGGNYPTTWDAFCYFGPAASRFDHHQLQARKPAVQNRGVMYLATGRQAIPTCLAEAFQATRIIDRHHNQPILTIFTLTRDLRLLDLSGPFCTAMGASTAIHSAPRPKTQPWSARLYDAYPSIDGLLYCSSMFGNAPAIAFYERALQSIPARPLFHRSLNDPALHQVILSTGAYIRYGVV